jgi:predicted ATPase
VRQSPRKDTVALLAAALGLTDEERTAFEAAAHAAHVPTSPPTPQQGARGVRLYSAIPIPPTPLMGREREEAAVTYLVQQQDVRLLTLTGAPGIGKTRLALQVAAGLHDTFADGVAFVGLAAIQDPALVLAALAQALGVHDTGDQPLHATLVVYLRERHLLLVLDNFEQVVAAAPTLADLLASCPHLTFLVTSRTALRLRGEQEFAVPPLALPDRGPLPPPEELLQYAAVALFVQRARAVKPPFALTAPLAPAIVAICRRLDGLPLALELAAARIKLLPPGELLRQLEHSLRVLAGGAQDLPERQRTLQSAIAWSYDLLPAAEQRLFRRLAVFVGGWTLEMAAAIGQEETRGAPGTPEAPEAPLAVLEGLSALVDKSLVLQLEPTANGEARFGLLETLRQYGLERLEACGELETYRRRHAQVLLHWVERDAPRDERLAAVDLIEEELGNLRAALEWALEQGEAEVGLRLTRMWGLWFVRGPFGEGVAWLEALLGLDQPDRPAGRPPVAAPVRARALRALAALRFRQQDFTQATALFEDSLALWRQVGDTEGIAIALSGLAHAACVQDDFARAQPLFEECLALTRTLGAEREIGRPRLGLAGVAMERGDYAQAEALYTEDFARQEAAQLAYYAAETLSCLGELYLRQGDFARAAPLLEESLRRARDQGTKFLAAQVLRFQAYVAYHSGALERAEALLDESLAVCRELGVKAAPYTLAALADVACLRGDYIRAAALYRQSLALNRMTYARLGPILGLEGLARVAHRQGRLADAVRLWAVAQAQREALGTPLWPIDRPAYERDLTALRAALGEDVWAAALAAGRALSLEEAIAEVLSEEESAPVITVQQREPS